jgi:hypothetical protein
VATLDGLVWACQHIQRLDVSSVFFRCVAKDDRKRFAEQLRSVEDTRDAVVGGSATVDHGRGLQQEVAPRTLGGVYLRAPRQQRQRGLFLHSEEAKNVLSDYYLHCRKTGTPMAPILVTLSPCGSRRTLRVARQRPRRRRDPGAGILNESVRALLVMFEDLARWKFLKKLRRGDRTNHV